MLLSHLQECFWMLLWHDLLRVSYAEEAWLAAGKRKSVSKKVLGFFSDLVLPILCQ